MPCNPSRNEFKAKHVEHTPIPGKCLEPWKGSLNMFNTTLRWAWPACHTPGPTNCPWPRERWFNHPAEKGTCCTISLGNTPLTPACRPYFSTSLVRKKNTYVPQFLQSTRPWGSKFLRQLPCLAFALRTAGQLLVQGPAGRKDDRLRAWGCNGFPTGSERGFLASTFVQ